MYMCVGVCVCCFYLIVCFGECVCVCVGGGAVCVWLGVSVCSCFYLIGCLGECV